MLYRSCAAAETFPAKSIRIIVAFTPGGGPDLVARLIARELAPLWGQQLVVDNRPGAGGIVGTELAARAAPDGYTVFTYGINQTITPHLYKKLPYDTQRDFAPLSLYATMPNILCVNLGIPANNVAEFIKHVKANPGKLKYGSSGIGATPHLTMALFAAINGLNLIHIPYKVASQGYTDAISGEIQTFFYNLPGPLPFVKAGRLRALAVTSAKRAEQLPQVPTVIESGIADFEIGRAHV